MIEVSGTIVTILLITVVFSYLISNINYEIDDQHLRIKIGAFAFRKVPVSVFKGVEFGVTLGGEN